MVAARVRFDEAHSEARTFRPECSRERRAGHRGDCSFRLAVAPLSQQADEGDAHVDESVIPQRLSESCDATQSLRLQSLSPSVGTCTSTFPSTSDEEPVRCRVS
jgi:hypothetical protein